jgi:hypothetical protein
MPAVGEAWSVPALAVPAVAGEQVARPVKPCNAPATKFSVGRMKCNPGPLQPLNVSGLEVLANGLWVSDHIEIMANRVRLSCRRQTGAFAGSVTAWTKR